MTDNLLQKLEEKMMILLTEFDAMRQELNRLKQENSMLKMDQVDHTRKLQGLVSLLDEATHPSFMQHDYSAA